MAGGVEDMVEDNRSSDSGMANTLIGGDLVSRMRRIEVRQRVKQWVAPTYGPT